MNLYLLTQTKNTGYDTYDSIVVAAKNSTDAARTPPDSDGDLYVPSQGSWASPEDVLVEMIGTARRGTKAGVILASFNAG